jgi:hypothetical protein
MSRCRGSVWLVDAVRLLLVHRVYFVLPCAATYNKQKQFFLKNIIFM